MAMSYEQEAEKTADAGIFSKRKGSYWRNSRLSSICEGKWTVHILFIWSPFCLLQEKSSPGSSLPASSCGSQRDAPWVLHGFRQPKGTTHMILTAWLQKCREQDQPLYLAFLKLIKIFESSKLEVKWGAFYFSCSEKSISQLHLLQMT